jgi:acetyltransferase-like isoleucine patch superfamily enzyme
MNRLARAVRNLPWRIAYAPGPGGSLPLGPKLSSRLRKWWVLYRHPLGTVRFEEPIYLGPGFSLHMPGEGTFIAGPGTDFRRDFHAEIEGNGRIVIGTSVAFTDGAVIQCGTSVEIGDRTMFGPLTTIVDGDHRYEDVERPILAQGNDYRPVTIGADVWVGARATIVGASVETRAVVAAGAVVTTDVPPYTVVGGVPARPLKYYGPPERAASA